MRGTRAHPTPILNRRNGPGARRQRLFQFLPIEEDLVGDSGRAFEGDREIVVGRPDTADVGIAPRCSGVRPGWFSGPRRIGSLPRRPRQRGRDTTASVSRMVRSRVRTFPPTFRVT